MKILINIRIMKSIQSYNILIISETTLNCEVNLFLKISLLFLGKSPPNHV